jgi:23S rRNA (pseudouridine1915-N3)-methyltransferase
MKIHLVLISENKPRIKDSHIASLLDEYIKRAGRFAQVDIVHYKPDTKLGLVDSLRQKYKQAHIVLLDENGKAYSSENFAEKLLKWHDTVSSEIVFVVGDSDGFTEAELKGVADKISLSQLTFHHELALLVLSEQVYRALCIINNHPYHRE